MNTFDSLTLTWVTLLLLATKDTQYFCIIALTCHFIVSLGLTVLCPESPAYLYETN